MTSSLVVIGKARERHAVRVRVREFCVCVHARVCVRAFALEYSHTCVRACARLDTNGGADGADRHVAREDYVEEALLYHPCYELHRKRERQMDEIPPARRTHARAHTRAQASTATYQHPDARARARTYALTSKNHASRKQASTDARTLAHTPPGSGCWTRWPRKRRRRARSEHGCIFWFVCGTPANKPEYSQTNQNIPPRTSEI